MIPTLKTVVVLFAHYSPGQEFRQGLVGMSVLGDFSWDGSSDWGAGWNGINWCPMSLLSGFLSSPCH